MIIKKLENLDSKQKEEFYDLLDSLKRRDVTDYTYVLVLDDSVYGYIALYKILDEINILYIYVDESKRGKGYGKSLLKYGIKFVAKENDMVYLEVRKSNIVAQNLYKSFGFIENGYRKAYYSDGEDAILMEMKVC
ncbi:MAG: ribosomal protein S18-alanine N-acetyltransferase [Gammaproteobacteria bacterium]|nr:ribosomal protein S18-alanine N-acetyltransferase [Gammaproteobacteria bacterium]